MALKHRLERLETQVDAAEREHFIRTALAAMPAAYRGAAAQAAATVPAWDPHALSLAMIKACPAPFVTAVRASAQVDADNPQNRWCASAAEWISRLLSRAAAFEEESGRRPLPVE